MWRVLNGLHYEVSPLVPKTRFVTGLPGRLHTPILKATMASKRIALSWDSTSPPKRLRAETKAPPLWQPEVVLKPRELLKERPEETMQ